jgi:NAD(P)H-dependent flavin oxidoreductase YrpB (nitropropane dioxygenase family)
MFGRVATGAFTENLGLELPIIQAGMGGGLAGAPLAAAVSEAGGLGTIGILAPDDLEAEIAAARQRTTKPIAANLLLPFARPGHWRAADAADVVVTFWGKPLRRTERTWIHQCGSVEEARMAERAGADAVIAQGVEAGGHVRGRLPALELLERVKAALPGGFPVLSAGGVAEVRTARERLDAGAAAVVSGTRFVLSEESGAHPSYQQRLLDADETILTELFGMGWPAAHRVVRNAATDRWLGDDRRGPGWLRAVHRTSAPVLSRVPMGLQAKLAGSQSADRPFFGPAAAVAGRPDNLVDAGPLYAGECVASITDIRPAAELVRELGGSLS